VNYPLARSVMASDAVHRSRAHAVRRARLARDLLHDRDGAPTY